MQGPLPTLKCPFWFILLLSWKKYWKLLHLAFKRILFRLLTCWAEGKINSASGSWGYRSLLNIFNWDLNLTKSKEYLKICIMPRFLKNGSFWIVDKGSNTESYFLGFSDYNWNMSVASCCSWGFILNRAYKAEKIWPLLSSSHSSPGVPLLPFTLHLCGLSSGSLSC